MRRRRPSTANLEPLSPKRKWRAITLATVLLAPAVWAILIGLVAAASDEADKPNAGAPIAFGLCLIPFVYMVLAFASQHPDAPIAVVKAMGMCLLVGIPASALAGDAITGIVAGVGAGGIFALRRDTLHTYGIRATGVAIAAAYAFLLARIAGPSAVVAAPVFPFTVLGLADHFAERQAAKEQARESSAKAR